MSHVDTLRRAAALMRERAETVVALSSPHEDPWYRTDRERFTTEDFDRLAENAPEDAEYIASWHPTVALAVANLLDAEATIQEMYPNRDDDDIGNALAVARAYLGTEEES